MLRWTYMCAYGVHAAFTPVTRTLLTVSQDFWHESDSRRSCTLFQTQLVAPAHNRHISLPPLNHFDIPSHDVSALGTPLEQRMPRL